MSEGRVEEGGIVFGRCLCHFFLRRWGFVFLFQKFFREVRGNDDVSIFQHHTEFLGGVAFFEGFAKILLQYSRRFLSCFLSFLTGSSWSSFWACRICAGLYCPAFFCGFFSFPRVLPHYRRNLHIPTISPLHDMGSSWQDGSCNTQLPSCMVSAKWSFEMMGIVMQKMRTRKTLTVVCNCKQDGAATEAATQVKKLVKTRMNLRASILLPGNSRHKSMFGKNADWCEHNMWAEYTKFVEHTEGRHQRRLIVLWRFTGSGISVK